MHSPYLDSRLLSFGTNLEDATSSPLAIQIARSFFSRAIYLKYERKSVKSEKNLESSSSELSDFVIFFAHDKIDDREGFEEWIRFGLDVHMRFEITEFFSISAIQRIH